MTDRPVIGEHEEESETLTDTVKAPLEKARE